MKPNQWILVPSLAALCLALATPAAEAQERFAITIGAMGGLGGSVDADPGDSLTNTAYQLTAALIIEAKTLLVVRAGHLNLDDDPVFVSLTDAGLDYVNIGGEYRYDHAFYESGVYLGLGGYRLDGNPLDPGDSETDTSFGVVLGLTGDFEAHPTAELRHRHRRALGEPGHRAGICHWAGRPGFQLLRNAASRPAAQRLEVKASPERWCSLTFSAKLWRSAGLSQSCAPMNRSTTRLSTSR